MKVCTKDNLFAVLDKPANDKYEFVVYNTTTKLDVQRKTLTYIPVDLICSNNELLISDSTG